jgi:hypothetical protein
MKIYEAFRRVFSKKAASSGMKIQGKGARFDKSGHVINMVKLEFDTLLTKKR